MSEYLQERRIGNDLFVTALIAINIFMVVKLNTFFRILVSNMNRSTQYYIAFIKKPHKLKSFFSRKLRYGNLLRLL